MTIAQRAVLLGMPRNHGIDILRGLAILLVVLHHTGLRIALKSTALADLLPMRVLAKPSRTACRTRHGRG